MSTAPLQLKVSSRPLGASRAKLALVAFTEAAMIAAAALVLGGVLSLGLLAVGRRLLAEETGLLLEINVAEVDPRCTGHLSLHYKDAIPEDALMRLPRRSLAFDVPPEYVFRAVGVPYYP